MERLSTIRRDFKSPGHPPRARGLSRYRHHLLTGAGIVLGASLIVSLLPHEAEATRSATAESTLDPVFAPSGTSTDEAAPAVFAETHEQAPSSTATPVAAAEPPPEWIQAEVRKGDSLSLIFKRHGLTERELHQVMSLGGETRALTKIFPGSEIRFRLDEAGALQALSYDVGEARTLQVQRQDSGFTADVIERELDIRTAQASGTIQGSLFVAANRAGLSDGLIMELVRIFGWDIDFALDIRQDDHFSLIYEEIYLEGEKLRDGRILAAEFVNRGKVFRAVRYTDAQNRADYYSPDGKSMRKAFLRSPVEYSRVSSRFSTGRMHPVLNRIRAHKGVDYAAPTGTPIKATGDGKVVLKGVNGGYGNTVIIQHGSRYSTLYAHLSGFARGLKQGDRVRQGQTIGYVGMSGLATGPHLHYEFRVDDIHRDPLKVQFPDAAPVPAQQLADFKTHTQPLLAQLEAAHAIHEASVIAADDAQQEKSDRVALNSAR
jgi:murein DD-endopeptidase MepM/ murein hydrolase activator NlpD